MPDKEATIKAAELLADWSKWLVTLQTAAIAATPYILGAKGDKPVAWENFDAYLKIGLCFFLASIIAGSVVLGNVPIVVTKFAADPGKPIDINSEPASPFGWLCLRIWMFAGLEHVCFIAGAVMLIIHLWGKR